MWSQEKKTNSGCNRMCRGGRMKRNVVIAAKVRSRRSDWGAEPGRGRSQNQQQGNNVCHSGGLKEFKPAAETQTHPTTRRQQQQLCSLIQINNTERIKIQQLLTADALQRLSQPTSGLRSVPPNETRGLVNRSIITEESHISTHSVNSCDQMSCELTEQRVCLITTSSLDQQKRSRPDVFLDFKLKQQSVSFHPLADVSAAGSRYVQPALVAYFSLTKT